MGWESGVSPWTVQGLRDGDVRTISSVADGSVERLAVDAKVSGVAEINLDADNDEVAVYGGVGGTTATRTIVNVDASGRVRVDLTHVGSIALAVEAATGRIGVAAKLQVGTTDVSATNPLPARVEQATRANLNANVHVQLGGVDVSTTNPFPVRATRSDNSAATSDALAVLSGIVGVTTSASQTTASLTSGNVAYPRLDLRGRVVVNPQVVRTYTNGTEYTLGTTATQVLTANTARTMAVFTNRSTSSRVYIGKSGVTSSSFVMMLNPGETWIMTPDAVDTGAWYAIADAASTPFTVSEVTLA
jgi:hypothetical protein